MRKRSGHWKRQRRRHVRLPFVGLVAGVAVVAFTVTLIWPSLPDLALTGPWSSSPIPAAPRFDCAVSYVHDGDTLRCSDGTRIRLHAVAAREVDGSCSSGHPCPKASAAAATARLRQLADARTIQCEAISTSYDRVTAVCWTPAGEEINCAMIESGVALVWDRFNRERPICSA
jgi:endonuclease YncB( thermonuclease family)